MQKYFSPFHKIGGKIDLKTLTLRSDVSNEIPDLQSLSLNQTLV